MAGAYCISWHYLYLRRGAGRRRVACAWLRYLPLCFLLPWRKDSSSPAVYRMPVNARYAAVQRYVHAVLHPVYSVRDISVAYPRVPPLLFLLAPNETLHHHAVAFPAVPTPFLLLPSCTFCHSLPCASHGVCHLVLLYGHFCCLFLCWRTFLAPPGRSPFLPLPLLLLRVLALFLCAGCGSLRSAFSLHCAAGMARLPGLLACNTCGLSLGMRRVLWLRAVCGRRGGSRSARGAARVLSRSQRCAVGCVAAHGSTASALFSLSCHYR